MISQGQPSIDNAPRPAIASIGVTIDKVDFRAQQQASVYGAKGTEHSGQTLGTLNMTDASGYHVTKDLNEHIRVDIPIINCDDFNAAKKNIKHGMDKLFPTKNNLRTAPNISTLLQPDQQRRKPNVSDILPGSLDTESHEMTSHDKSAHATGGDLSLSPSSETLNDEGLPKLDKSSAPEPKQENEQKSNPRRRRPELKLKTKDVRVGTKTGGGGKPQSYDIDDNKYINQKGGYKEASWRKIKIKIYLRMKLNLFSKKAS